MFCNNPAGSDLHSFCRKPGGPTYEGQGQTWFELEKVILDSWSNKTEYICFHSDREAGGMYIFHNTSTKQ